MSPEHAIPAPRITWFMVLVNYYPSLFLLAGGLLVFLPSMSISSRIALGVFWIYLLPPLLCRLALGLWGYPLAAATIPRSGTYQLWWFLTQVQMLFNRIGALEEILRLLPGMYGLWLNLWGSSVSLLAYWGPGVLVTDRYLVKIGRGVVLGSRCLIGSHLITHTEEGDYRLTVAWVRIDAGAIVSTQAAIGPGCHIVGNELLPAGRLLPPFTTWKAGKKFRENIT